MTDTRKAWLFWAPRLLTLAFAVFISMFALDVFSESLGFWRTTVALLLHLAPTAVVLTFLGIAWRWPWIGGLLFITLGFLYLASVWGRFSWTVYAAISGPLFLIGILFILDSHHEVRPRTG